MATDVEGLAAARRAVVVAPRQYEIGERVQLWSKTISKWIVGVVQTVNEDATYDLDRKSHARCKSLKPLHAKQKLVALPSAPLASILVASVGEAATGSRGPRSREGFQSSEGNSGPVSLEGNEEHDGRSGPGHEGEAKKKPKLYGRSITPQTNKNLRAHRERYMRALKPPWPAESGGVLAVELAVDSLVVPALPDGEVGVWADGGMVAETEASRRASHVDAEWREERASRVRERDDQARTDPWMLRQLLVVPKSLLRRCRANDHHHAYIVKKIFRAWQGICRTRRPKKREFEGENGEECRHSAQIRQQRNEAQESMDLWAPFNKAKKLLAAGDTEIDHEDGEVLGDRRVELSVKVKSLQERLRLARAETGRPVQSLPMPGDARPSAFMPGFGDAFPPQPGANGGTGQEEQIVEQKKCTGPFSVF